MNRRTTHWLTAAVVAAAVAVSPLGAGERRKIVFWNLFTTGKSHEVVTKLVHKFNTQVQSECVVEQVDIPYMQLHTKILPAIAGRVPPDVSVLDRFRVAKFAARGAFRPLDDLAKRDGIKREDFFAAPWDECLYEGRLYAVPYDTDVRILYYNKTMFKARAEQLRRAGLDPNRPPKTWKELRAYSKVLTEIRADGYLERAGYLPVYGNTGIYLYGWQKGGRFMSPDGRKVTLNDPKIVEAVGWLKEFSDDYGVERMLSFREGFGNDAQNPFITGKLAMVVWDVGVRSTIQRYGSADLEWGTAPCPYPEDGVPATWSGGFSLVVPEGCRHAEDAWAFCRFILSRESQRYMATSSNKLPALRSAADDPFFRTSAFWRLAIDQMRVSHYRPISPVGAAMSTELQTALDHVVHGKLTPKEAMDIASDATQRELDNFRAKRRGPEVRWHTVGLVIFGGVGLLVLWRGWRSVRRIRTMRLRRREAMAGYSFAAPAIVGLAIFMLGPMIMTLLYSFTRYDIIAPATWSGVENYRRLFTEDRFFLKALWNTFYFAAVSVPVNIALALGLAMLLNCRIAGRPIYRTCFYLPRVVPIVAGSLLWAWLFNGDYGLINVTLHFLHLPPVPWLTSEYWSKPALIVMGAWSVGGGMIIFLAALQGVPKSLYEAAEIDGAGALGKFRNVTLPMISPAMFFMVVMGIIGSLQVFAQAYLMTSGGPVNSTLFYVLYLFREAFENLHMGYASAMAWVLFLFIMLVTGIQFLLAKRWVYYEGVKQ